jgi:hypothetical protein
MISISKNRPRTENELLVEAVENSGELPYKYPCHDEKHQKELLRYLEDRHYWAVPYSWPGHEYAVYIWR